MATQAVRGSTAARCARTLTVHPSRGSLRVQAIATTTSTSTKDMTAQLLQGAIQFALQTRLKSHAGIQVDVQSNAFDLLQAKFGGMTVNGRQWRTPLELTADTIQVSVGELVVDQAALLFQQKVALKGVPTGMCTLVLSPRDLGNFMVHDLMKKPSSKAIQGHPVKFDPSSVHFNTMPNGEGQILYRVQVGKAGHTLWVAMDAPLLPSRPALKPRPQFVQQKPIRVTARHMVQDQAHNKVAPGLETYSPHEREEVMVSKGLGDLFNGLKLNLQGVELSKPCLRLFPESNKPHGQHDKQPLLLEISMQLRLLDLPPLNMKF